MSGFEIAGLVLGIVDLYPMAEKYVKKWRKRNRKGETDESESLEESLQYGGKTIQDVYDRDFRRLGKPFAKGDGEAQWIFGAGVRVDILAVIAQNGLMQQRIRLDDRVITVLLDALDNKNGGKLDYRALHGVSRSVRRGTISELGDLYQRKSQAAPIRNQQLALPAPSSSRKGKCRGSIQYKKSSVPLVGEDKWACTSCDWSSNMYQAHAYNMAFQHDWGTQSVKTFGRQEGWDGYVTRDRQRMGFADFARRFHHCGGGSKWKCDCCDEQPVFGWVLDIGKHVKAKHSWSEIA